MKLFIEVNILMTIFFGFYWLIRERIDLTYRRFVLLAIPFVAVLIPLVKMQLMASGIGMNVPLITLDAVVIEATHKSPTQMKVDWQFLYIMVSAVCLLFVLWRFARILYFFRKAVPYISDPSKRILISESRDSFSFLHFIHLSADLNEEERHVVLEHELLHCSMYHSIDLILMQIYQALFWINPLMIAMKRELMRTHEFQVDQQMYERYNHTYLKHLLSFSLGSTVAHLLLTSQFNGKMDLAKRIKKMKHKTKKKNLSLLVMPVVAVAFALVSWTSQQSPKTPVTSSFVPTDTLGKGEVDKMPEFKGGQEALIKFMGEHVKYPAEARKSGLEGTVYVEFVVKKSGALSKVKLKKGPNPLLNEEAVRVVELMPPWSPGEKDGKPVDVQMVLPIQFKL